MAERLATRSGRKIAYCLSAGGAPGIVFLGGFRSDMEGTKARHLEAWAKATDRAFLRFDYSGHGQSSEAFEDGCIGDWAEDALEAISGLTSGRQILVGSSMGGWIACLVARAMPDRVSGLVGIAAAPDFTEDSMWASFSQGQKTALETGGRVLLASDYSDGPYVITRRLIEDGRDHLVLRTALAMPFPVRLLQGTADKDVDVSVALSLLSHIDGNDVRLTLVAGVDHRFSDPNSLRLIERTIEEICS